jgi:hypothetical protein
MFTPTRLLANYNYNKGRRDEQEAVENILEVLTIEGLLHPSTLNLIVGELIKVDRRPKLENK